MDKDIKKLLHAESAQLKKLQAIVADAIQNETLVINNLEHPPKEVLTQGQRISDKVARFGGSWSFIISFFVILIVWITFNSIALAKDAFDPYPFILMNLDMMPSPPMRMSHENQRCLAKGCKIIMLKIPPNVFREFHAPSHINRTFWPPWSSTKIMFC